jgi:predicted NACHT family NTPase
MAKRSLQASVSGIKKAKQHFATRNWTQDYLANEVGIKTRQPIWRFFAGQSIERYTFFEICTTLDLDWREIAIDPPAESRLEAEEFETNTNTNQNKLAPQMETLSLDALVKTVRSQWSEKVEHQCGTLEVLDINRPASIDKIYVDVNVFQEMANQQWLGYDTLTSLTPQDMDESSLDKIVGDPVSAMQALEKHRTIRLLGKPGCGKSTFLQYLAIQCNREKFALGHVPILIRLRDFARSYQEDSPQLNFLEYIHQEFFTAGLADPTVIMNLLQGGRILLLIDGLDELGREKENIALNEIRRFFEKYYKNKFVVTCRTTMLKLALKGFTDIQIAPFTEAQITAFTRKWFVECGKPDGSDGLKNADQFMRKLTLPENKRIRRLATTPLFLHLACSTFYRLNDFASKRIEFYKQALELLLGKWDEARGIQRTIVYSGFGLSKKLNYACELALETFEKGQYFFKEDVLEKFTVNYIRNQVDADTDPEEIYESTEAVLMAIKAQYHGLLVERAHGIFSFSYLAFQEYLIARKISSSCNIQSSEQCLHQLIDHICNRHWREIFLLTANMLGNADDLLLLMSKKIDTLISSDSSDPKLLQDAKQLLLDISDVQLKKQ